MSHAPERPLRVLFACTENAARSQIAEALLRRCLVPFEKLQRAALEHRLAAMNRADASDGAGR